MRKRVSNVRVVAGKFKGSKIPFKSSKDLRPTTNKNKADQTATADQSQTSKQKASASATATSALGAAGTMQAKREEKPKKSDFF